MAPDLVKELPDVPDCSEERTTSRIYPDIIIHRRGAKFKNLLVIEIKTNSNDRSCDYEKLKLLTLPKPQGHFRYVAGLFIKFDRKGDYELVWFHNGK